MTCGQAYLSGWKETFNFSGRASRQQFWTFFLINVLIATAPLAAWCLATSVNPQYGILSFVVIPFAALWLLLMALPFLAYSLLGHRAREAMPRIREWLTTHGWLVNIVVIVYFIFQLLK